MLHILYVSNYAEIILSSTQITEAKPQKNLQVSYCYISNRRVDGTHIVHHIPHIKQRIPEVKQPYQQ